MKVLVTGGAGYIGSVATERLLDEDHDVTVFDNLERGHREAVDDRARLIEGDLRNCDDIIAAVKDVAPDAVMHFAAYAYVGESMEDPTMYFKNNVGGAVNLAEAMDKASVKKIIFSSTCATYGQPDRVPISEDESQKPENPYGESKLIFEKILTWYRNQRGFQPVFLRYFNAAGATEKFGEDHTPESHLIPLVLLVAQGKRDNIKIFGGDYDTPDGTCIRDYIHIQDLAQAHVLALTGDHVGAFNLGNGEGYSVKEVIETARKITGHEIPAEMTDRRAGDPPRLIARSKKAFDQLSWKPRFTDLKTIIEHAWKWHQAHPDGYSSDAAR